MEKIKKSRLGVGLVIMCLALIIAIAVGIVIHQNIGRQNADDSYHVKVMAFWDFPEFYLEVETVIIEEEIPIEPIMHDWLMSYFEQNDELIGWITVNGTNIDAPVYQVAEFMNYHSDHWNFYLQHNRDRIRDGIGEIYLWPSELEIDEKDLFFVFGHNFGDNRTQFSQLVNYWFDADFRDQLEIRFFTRYDEFVYEIVWGAMAENWGNYVKFFNQNTRGRSDNRFIYHELVVWENQAQFEQFVILMDEYALHPRTSDVSFEDQFIFLLTCESNLITPRRKIIVGRRLE